jgi:hypothetical protein
LRIAGVALLGVAAIAAVVGLISFGGQGTSSAPAAPPTAAAPPAGVGQPPAPGQPGAVDPNAPAPGAPAPGQPGGAAPGQPGAAAPGAGLPGAVGAPAPGAAPPVLGALPPVAAAPPIVPGGSGGGTGSSGGGSAGGGGGAAFGTVPVRVYNNSMIVGLAEKAGDQMRARGFDVVETGNYPQGLVPVSTAYYRPGTDEQAAADAAAAAFGLRSEPRFPGIANASPGVIVIATNNWGQTAQKGS